MRQVIAGVLLVLGLLIAAPSQAQTTVTPGQMLAWDQPATSQAEAQGFSYRIYRDGAAAPIVLTAVTCSAPGVGTPSGSFPCETPFLADTPGAPHSIEATASNQAGESLRSTPFNYIFIALPQPPRNLRIR
jgi:hypothetical protein